MENRLEVGWWPIVILPWKKSINTLYNWIKKEMWNYPETWKWFFAYFDKEPTNGWKVDGYAINLSNQKSKKGFTFRSNYYEINPHKFDKIGWAKSVFQHTLQNANDIKDNTINKIEEVMKKINVDNRIKHSISNINSNNKLSFFDAYDNVINDIILKASLDNWIIDEKEYLNSIKQDSWKLKPIKVKPIKDWDEDEQNNYKKTEELWHIAYKDYFNIEWINSVEILKEKWAYLYFELNETTKRSKRVDFLQAIKNWDLQLAKKLYLEALSVTKNKLERIGLTPEQNKFIIDCFRKRDYDGIKKILDETKDVVWKNMQVEDTEHKYKTEKIVDEETWQEIMSYDNTKKEPYTDPITQKEVFMTRKELHERIIEKFLLDWESSKWNKQLIMSWWLPGAWKSTIEEAIKDIPKVIVNPDKVKDYLPEYYDEKWRKFWAEIVHKESSYVSKIIYDRAIKWWYSVLYDSSMKDDPSKNFPKYNKIVESAHKQWYSIEARFIYDGWEARYRNTVIRERSMWLKNYNAYWTAYKTIEYLSKDKRVNRVIIHDNSINGKPSWAKIIYENQEINTSESDPELIKKFNDYQLFLDKLL